MQRSLRFASALALVAVASAAQAATTTVNLAGFSSYDSNFPGSLNTQLVVPIAPNAGVTAISYSNLVIQLSNGSYASEFTLSTNQSSNTGAAGTFWDYSPFATSGTPNPAGPISGSFPNPSPNFNSGPFNLLADGNLLLYVYETFDDAGPAVDATVISGTLTITTGTITPPPPPTPPVSIVTSVGGPGVNGSLGAAGTQFYSFTLTSPQAVSFDTYGTTGLQNASGSPDTELFLFDSTGALLGTDDDDGTAAGGGELLSILNSGDELPALLPAGTYYLGIGAFNSSSTGTGFNLTSTSTFTGAYHINGLSVVPEPTTLAALGLGGLLLRRRRA